MSTTQSTNTHEVTVGAFLVPHDEKLLLLLRNNEPVVWAPPGGMLHEDEDPHAGLIRECLE